MATVGRRKIGRNKVSLTAADKPSWGIGPMQINLILSPIQLQPVATQGFDSPVLGVPIMREGFVTETGFLLGSPESAQLASNFIKRTAFR